jgi:2-methylisocitrate lyase-like PEP mutase family enzyme
MSRSSRRNFIKGAGLVAGGLFTQGVNAQSPAAAARSKGDQFRTLLQGADPVLAPAAHDVLTARLIEANGFAAITVGGSAVSAEHMIPDVGLITITELLDFAGNIAEHVNIPVFADCDDGGGTPINVYRAMRNAEKREIAAVMFEDTVTIKHLGGRSDLVTKEQMADKIKAAVDARQKGTVVIARTDALAEQRTMEEAMERGALCAAAGADVIFFSGMQLTDTPKARDAVKKPLMSTVGGTTTPAMLKAARISLGVYAGQILQISLGAAHQALQELKATGLMTNAARLTIPTDFYQKLTETQVVSSRYRYYIMINCLK